MDMAKRRLIEQDGKNQPKTKFSPLLSKINSMLKKKRCNSQKWIISFYEYLTVLTLRVNGRISQVLLQPPCVDACGFLLPPVLLSAGPWDRLKEPGERTRLSQG